jgi:hypothetical protein
MNPTEHQIESAIWQILRASGYYCFKHKDQSKRVNGAYRKCQMSINGVADLCVFVNGRVIYLEVKTPTGKQSADQIEFERMCKKNNIPYHIVTSAKQALEIVTALDSGRSKIDSKRL